MNLIVVFVCGLLSGVTCVEHATDIQIDKVEVIEIPWQEGSPQQGGNPPPPVYGPPPDCPPPNSEFQPPVQEPKPVYGPPPEVTTTTELPTTTESGSTTELPTTTDGVTTTELPTTTGNPVNETNIQPQKLRVKEEIKGEDLDDQGVYYFYHPGGLLQRVAYLTKNDEENMEYTAKLKYQNVEPIKGPIYTYDPNTFEVQRINT